MTFTTFDPHDQEWETSPSFRTVYKPGHDDTYCEICNDEIVDDPTSSDGLACGCTDD